MEDDIWSIEAAVAAALTEYRRIAAHAGAEFDVLAENPTKEAFENAVTVENRDGHVQVRVHGVFDSMFGFDVRNVIRQLDDAEPTSIHVLVESPGGVLRDGLAIYNDLRARADKGVKVTTEARGIVASAAVLPFLAGSERTMSEGTRLMVHEAHVGFMAFGQASDIRKLTNRVLKALDNSNKTMVNVYVGRTGLTKAKVNELLSEETWFTPEEALESKFATEVVDRSAAEDEPDDETLAAARQILTMNRLRIENS